MLHADPSSLPYALGHLAQLHLWAGRWDEAELCRVPAPRARRGDAPGESGVLGTLQPGDGRRVPRSDRRGRAGRPCSVRRGSRRRCAVDGTQRRWAARVPGDVARRRRGRRSDVRRATTSWPSRCNSREPGYNRFLGDYVEALVATGDVDRARAVLDVAEEHAVRTGRRVGAGRGAARQGARRCARRRARRCVRRSSRSRRHARGGRLWRTSMRERC